MCHKITRIQPSDWMMLRDLCKTNWPENIASYQTIDNFIRWYNQDPKLEHVNFYSLNGDWSDGTFLIVVSNCFKLILYIKLLNYNLYSTSIAINCSGIV